MSKENVHILKQLKRGMLIALVLAVVGEMIFFPSLANFYGCVMAVIAYGVFTYFLKEAYIRYYPFAFLMYLSMFMYRFLPLLATIIEGKPITFGFERPYETFLYEILLFLVSSLAFYLACRNPEKISKKKNNFIQRSLDRVGFFEITPAILWGMGAIGFVIRIYNFSAGDVEYGDVGGKFLIGLDYLMYAPLCLFFPSLLKLKYENQKALFIYAGIIFIINIASNSRESIIMPIATVFILFFLFLVLNNLKLTSYISPTKMLVAVIFLLLVLSLLSKVSLAMLHTRNVRDDIDKLELFQKTIETVQDEALMKRLKATKDRRDEKLKSYQQGWTEYYVDNFMLQRYANMRITDETLYYAEKRGYGNKEMQKLFKENIIVLFPTPVLGIFGVSIDKSKMEFSRGDFLYKPGFKSFIVTSHVGDGLATFGHWYFLIQFFAFYLVFKVLNSYILHTRQGIKYAPFALINVFLFLGMFRNANGVSSDISFLLRGFLQGVITYLILFHLVKLAIKLFNLEESKNNALNTNQPQNNL
ncbi:hypothetical protein [Zobellia laminariae]|uniref:hypothetical protein n=1 Tax=Zobellia laminariae TaxID=248906 RepID=UPI0026F4280C|nr:hypothetical protein [Zobellia laminariae]WKX77478.1 hypothetical protein Q5W13_05370 [Zobellia laminariae]